MDEFKKDHKEFTEGDDCNVFFHGTSEGGNSCKENMEESGKLARNVNMPSAEIILISD